MRIWLIAAVLALGAPAAVAQQFRQKDFDAYVRRGLQTLRVPGVAVAVVKDGKLVFAQGYGVRTLGDTGRVDAHTLFQIASNTKAFTTAALAMLVDEGKLAWDDPVTKYLPDFQLYDPYVTREFGSIRATAAPRSSTASAPRNRRRASAAGTPTTTCCTSRQERSSRPSPEKAGTTSSRSAFSRHSA